MSLCAVPLARGLRAAALVLILAFVPMTVTALPPILPATTVEVGALGVDGTVPYAAAEGGLLVAPGSRVTFTAPYSFDDATGPSSGTYLYVATLRVRSSQGQVGLDTVTLLAGTGAVATAGSLTVEVSLPEILRGLVVELEASLWHAPGTGNYLLGQAFSSAPLTVAAVPEPVPFLTEDLLVADALPAGTIGMTGAAWTAAPTDGHTFVSLEPGLRVTATATVERPTIAAASYFSFSASVGLSVAIENGPSYGVFRTVFADFCSDWVDHACTAAAETRTVDLELILPPLATGPHSIATTQLWGNAYNEAFDAPTGTWVFEVSDGGGAGRHVVVTA